MKKIIKSLLCLAFLLSAIMVVMPHTYVHALSGFVMNTNYRDYGLSRNLFEVFLELYKEVKHTNVAYFESDFFDLQSGKFESEKSEYADIEIITDFRNGILNLTTGENGYACLRNCSPIYSIGDLSALNLSGIRQIILDDNSISNVSSKDFLGFDDLTSISIRNNQIASFKLNSTFVGKITSLDLSNNMLTSVDLSCLRTSAEVNLSKNRLQNLSDITFPDVDLQKLDLSFNNLTSERDMSVLLNVCHVKPIMLVQGLSKNDFVMTDIMTIYNDDASSALRARVNYQANSSYAGNGEIISSSGGEGFDVLHLPAGKIKINFEFDSLPSGANALNLVPKSIDCKPMAPTYHTICDGVSGTAISFSKNFDLTFDYNIPETLPNKAIFEDGYTLRVSSGGNMLSGTSFPITSNGGYVFSAVTLFDGLSSDVLSVVVKKENPMAFSIITILVVGVIVVIASIAVLIPFFKNGGQVAPLNRRELAMIRRRDGRRFGREYEFDDSQVDSADEEVDSNESEEEDFVDLDEDDD